MAKSANKGAATATPKKVNPSAQRAAEICKDLGVDKVWANDKGEYFTEENRALLSVNQEAKRVTRYDASYIEVSAEKSEGGIDDGGTGETEPA